MFPNNYLLHLVLPKFHINFIIGIIVFFAFLSNILIIANPEISSMNGASTFINVCSFGFEITCFEGKNSINLFKKAKA